MVVVEQLPGEVREFARYLGELLARLDQRGGWCGVFWQRDPEGMRACLDGAEVPPWDVVEALLLDLAQEAGPETATLETERARTLHGASLAAYDSRPGGREALGGRLDQMVREQRFAAERRTELTRLLAAATSAEEAESIRLDLAWATDDHERATARCAELRHRIQELAWRAVGGQPRAEGARRSAAGPSIGSDDPFLAAPSRQPAPQPAGPGAPFRAGPEEPERPQETTEAQPQHDVAPGRSGAKTKQRFKRRTRGSARFAGLAEETESAAVPAMPAPEPTSRSPRGARFAGAAETPAAQPEPEPAEPAASDVEARRITHDTVQTLVRLRAQGRSGEAHGVLVEAAYWPADRFPLLAAELQRAGLGADWATLLWEAASLPPERLVAAAAALTSAGRVTDGEQMLRQGVVRPAQEIGAAVVGLLDEGLHREARSLLDAYVRMRTPEEAARSALPAPDRLVPLLLEAARGVSQERHWDLLHAVRMAGLAS